jgi:(p)ppGpp synthase/HD superfamily hydrolase
MGTFRAVESGTGAVVMGPRFRDALVWAGELHERQTRKGVRTPYVGHLLGVCALVIAAGGDEDQAIAALLHDAVEDQPVTIPDVEERFGPRVAKIVDACTDSYERPKKKWRKRKEQYLERLPNAPDDALLVVVADKLDNARAILADVRREGTRAFDKFNGKQDGTVWYYGALLDILIERFPHPLTEELASIVGQIQAAASTS